MNMAITQNSTMSELVQIYNKFTGKKIKKFENKKVAIERTRAVLKSKPKQERKKRDMNFRFPPFEKIKPPKEGTSGDRVLKLISRETGATYEEILPALNIPTHLSMYERLRILHYRNGYGMWNWKTTTGNDRVKIVSTKAEYAELLEKEKNAN